VHRSPGGRNKPGEAALISAIQNQILGICRALRWPALSENSVMWKDTSLRVNRAPTFQSVSVIFSALEFTKTAIRETYPLVLLNASGQPLPSPTQKNNLRRVAFFRA
jgi:hypothetical protein